MCAEGTPVWDMCFPLPVPAPSPLSHVLPVLLKKKKIIKYTNYTLEGVGYGGGTGTARSAGGLGVRVASPVGKGRDGGHMVKITRWGKWGVHAEPDSDGG